MLTLLSHPVITARGVRVRSCSTPRLVLAALSGRKHKLGGLGACGCHGALQSRQWPLGSHQYITLLAGASCNERLPWGSEEQLQRMVRNWYLSLFL